MSKYIALIDYTDQGMRAIQDSPNRAEAFQAKAREAGVKIEELYWTFGAHDGVLILEAADDAAISSLMLWLGTQGNVRTTTLRAYDRGEMQNILAGAG